MKMDFAKLIVDLSSPNKKCAASASADLASQIWAGSVDEATLIQWLESDDETLRATTSWAVWDAGSPPHAMKRLMELGASDENETVRLYCLRSWIDYHPKDVILWSRDHILALIAEYLEGIVEDRSQLGEDRATTNATNFVMLDLRLWDASVDTYSFRPIVDSDNPIDQ